jgi:hypothetical protein
MTVSVVRYSSGSRCQTAVCSRASRRRAGSSATAAATHQVTEDLKETMRWARKRYQTSRATFARRDRSSLLRYAARPACALESTSAHHHAEQMCFLYNFVSCEKTLIWTGWR